MPRGGSLGIYEASKKKKNFAKAISIVNEHAEELSVRKKQLTMPGAYNVVDVKPWLKEVAFFLKKVVVPVVGSLDESQTKRLVNIIDDIASNYSGHIRPNQKITPVEYEVSIAVKLQNQGWNARTTKASGDQGVDVIATKNGNKLVIQCKLYTSPVGNSAVQQIVAGRIYENAQYAAVVSNVGYTKSARQLAHSANVLLLHHDEIDNIDAKLKDVGALGL